MATFLFAWELGGGLGHSVPLSLISRPLLDSGHRVHVALRDLSTAVTAFGDLARHPRLTLWQAPVWLAALRGLPESATYAELLFRAGFLDPRRLLGLALGWRSLVDRIRPDLLLVDHAPTALLATRGWPLRRAAIGTGFFQPPATSPIPAFRTWEPVDAARVAQSEGRAVATANAVLRDLAAPSIEHLHELLTVDENFLLTWPEVDHYAERARALATRYWGPLPTAAHGAAPVWADGDGPRVFAYLKGEYGPVETMLTALRTAPFRTHAYVPGLSPESRRRASSDRLTLSPTPVSMAAVCEAADAVLCNAGSGTVCTVLRAGIPVVLLPMHAEQLLFAMRVAEHGAGLTLTEADARTRLVPALGRVLNEPAFRASASSIARKYGGNGAQDVAAAVAARCEELAGTPLGAGG